MPGGLGTACTGNGDCASGQCGSDAAGAMYCVETCDPAANACPSGFDCQAAGDSGVCWPGGDDGGGCSTNTSSSGGAGLLLLGLAAMFVTRRRRK
jgi:MYXO-CTERM domain-containing protein